MPSKKIVIAEASSTIKSVADSLLRQHGYDVVSTSDGLQAWEVIQAERPDLVLIGLNLSGVPGLELCRQMTGDRVAGGIPSLLIVGANDHVSRDELVLSGARGHLKKPFSPKDLIKAVNKLIGPGDTSKTQDGRPGNSTKTSYSSEELSTTKHLQNDSEQIHNISWGDMNESSNVTGQAPVKVGSINASSDDQELEIEKDQFGLTRADLQNKSKPRSERQNTSDEDYDWFVGEMKKEVEGGGESTEDVPGRDDFSSPAGADIYPQDDISFDDQDTGDNLVMHEPAGGVSDGQGSRAGQSGGSASPLSESEIERIAEKVAEKLAASLAASIDKKTLIKVIKSTADDQ